MNYQAMHTDPDKLTKQHKNLIHSEHKKVVSHSQRELDDWILHSLMIEDCPSPFKFKRKQAYKNLTGARVNLTYYPAIESIAGLEFEIMKVVRIKQA